MRAAALFLAALGAASAYETSYGDNKDSGKDNKHFGGVESSHKGGKFGGDNKFGGFGGKTGGFDGDFGKSGGFDGDFGKSGGNKFGGDFGGKSGGKKLEGGKFGGDKFDGKFSGVGKGDRFGDFGGIDDIFTCYEDCSPYNSVGDFCSEREAGRACARRCQPYIDDKLWSSLHSAQDAYCGQDKYEDEWDAYGFLGYNSPAHLAARSYSPPDAYESYNAYESSYPSHQHQYNKDVYRSEDKRGGYDNYCCSSAVSMTQAVGVLAPVVAAVAVGLGNGRL